MEVLDRMMVTYHATNLRFVTYFLLNAGFFDAVDLRNIVCKTTRSSTNAKRAARLMQKY